MGVWWTYYWGVVHFALGTFVGSFLNVCIWRLPRGESILTPPSHCPACNHRLHLWPDMVPLLSQLWQRSRCRYCGAGFSWRYFWVEAVTGGLFLLAYLSFREDPWALYPSLVLLAALVVIFLIDLDHYLIDELVVYVAIAAGVVKDIALIQQGARPLMHTIPGTAVSLPLPISVIGAIVGFGLLWSFATLMTAVLNREAMGSGDSFLLAAMGANLVPWSNVLLAFFIAVAVGTVVGLTQLYLAGRSAPKQPAADEIEDHPRGEEERVEEASEASDEMEIPCLTRDARIGRFLALGGGWLALVAIWLALALWNQGQAAGAVAVVVAGLAGGAAGIVIGTRRWIRGDAEWLHQMDELFEGENDPGPRIIPFGPYLVIGTVIALFWGDGIVAWYLRWVGLTGPGSGAYGPGF